MMKRNVMPFFKLQRCFVLMIILTTLFLFSCAGGRVIKGGKDFDFKNISRIEVDKTTMTEIYYLFGDPVTKEDIKSGESSLLFGYEDSVTEWRYFYLIVGSNIKTLSVYFKKDGRVSDYGYGSTFEEDKDYPVKKTKNFDVFLIREQIQIHKSTKAEVLSLMGGTYKIVNINKPNVYERWHYYYDETKKAGKSLYIDFDRNGVVVDVKVISGFSEDKKRFFAK